MFRATHLDGPLVGTENDMSMAAPRVPERLFYAPAPDAYRGPQLRGAGYILVGWDQEPEFPWPRQVEYRLVRERSELEPHPQLDYAEAGMEQGLAVYRFADAWGPEQGRGNAA
jgi:hypothetical protein